MGHPDFGSGFGSGAPVLRARVLVARVGAEVGAVSHDVGFAVLYEVGNHAPVAGTLYSAHAGLDRIGLVELGEVFEAGDDEDALGTSANGCGEDLEGRDAGFAGGGEHVSPDDVEDYFEVVGARADQVLGEEVEGEIGIGDGGRGEDGEVAVKSDGGLVVGGDGRKAAGVESLGFIRGEAFVGVFALIVVDEGVEGQEGEVEAGLAEGGGGEDEAGGRSAFDDGGTIVLVGRLELAGGAGLDDGLFEEGVAGFGLGGLGQSRNGGEGQEGEGEGAHVRKSIAARGGASAEDELWYRSAHPLFYG
jgi:hypothetical protein